MALHPDFPCSPYDIVDPNTRWFPADEALRESSYKKLLPTLVHELREKVAGWRDSSYEGVADTSISLLNWWFKTEHLMPRADGSMVKFEYYFAHQEAVEPVLSLHEDIVPS
jgi:type III restriction enzyme